MNKEVHYEGWLIKSPPTKRIWRARWRRRWFTLKQGEIPEQFCLEYYTDRNCRKLKGVIDLDQCEQVDCGLRLENRKQKFQFMFDIKTPRRTYYLAADTEADMRDWVNCICQVCHLHDTKQSNDLQDDNQAQNVATSMSLSTTLNTTNNTTTTSLNSSDNPTMGATRNSSSSDILRRQAEPVIEQQPLGSATLTLTACDNKEANAYVNTEYTNRETMLCDALLGKQQQQQMSATPMKSAVSVQAALPSPPPQVAPSPPPQVVASRTEVPSLSQAGPSPLQAVPFPSKAVPSLCEALPSPPPQVLELPLPQTVPPSSPVVASTAASSTSAAIYLNSSIFQRQQPSATRLAVNANGVVRKIPENLVLKSVPLVDSQQNSVQPSPALSTASGPYIPISECFSGSPKFLLDGNNPTTPLNNLDPKFYDTPRSHNTIGLNLTNDKSYSPKITNCGGVQQPQATPGSAKGRSGRSDSDSESVFTDDEEWTHPMPLRESIDRHTRPSDSSVENDSFVFTYSQRFSKLPDDISKEQPQLSCNNGLVIEAGSSEKLDKELKNNLTLDDKTSKETPQFSDTENASPAMGPGDAKSVVDESYDIPRSHYLPYCNMDQLFKKTTSPEVVHSIVTSTPTLLVKNNGPNSSTNARTLPRPHCYTNAAPSKKEENVFRYDFMEQADLPPVNRNLKPKVGLEDKPPEEKPAKPPLSQPMIKPQNPTSMAVEGLTNKIMITNIHGTSVLNKSAPVTAAAAAAGAGAVATPSPSATFNTDNLVLHPPSVDRKLKPSAYKLGNSATIGHATRRSFGAPLSMVLDDENESKYIMEACTLPRHPRPMKYTTMTSGGLANAAAIHSAGYSQQQRIALAKAGIQMMHSPLSAMLLLPKNEHKLQYFDLDVSNPPPVVHRQSMSVGNLNAPTATAAAISRFALPADPSARAPPKSSVVYNSVDFIKTEAFNRVREERIRETEVIKILNK